LYLVKLKKNTMKNAISWFEIPATDYERAKTFYNTMLGIEIADMPMPEGKYGMFPFDQENNGVGGGIMQMEGVNPSAEGVTIYLNGGDDLSGPLSRVEAAGGKIIMPKTDIGENGFMAQLLDTEGNRVALHSWK
jgi:predicted enzyme related to lactoylglutathione lyase